MEHRLGCGQAEALEGRGHRQEIQGLEETRPVTWLDGSQPLESVAHSEQVGSLSQASDEVCGPITRNDETHVVPELNAYTISLFHYFARPCAPLLRNSGKSSCPTSFVACVAGRAPSRVPRQGHLMPTMM